MDKRIEIRRTNRGGNYEVNYYEGRQGKAAYHNLLSPNAAQLAVVLIDLEVTTALPIFEAVKIYLNKRDGKDWMGL